ncbi:hypothetical protein GIB67_004968 [Kingdonia uniflora]|uniref:Uncharacterized protein n=1 Tax=Kingdonia uniflora TaxID=39325 RepID=A0A7J7NMP7_9MAGN|nr:hypothetical protein GIB67_004968 [Kingdonia uniflora]
MPLTNLVKGIMNIIGVCPVQLNENMWEVINVCEFLNKLWEENEVERRISPEVILQFYGVKNLFASGGAYFSASSTRPLFFDLNSAGRIWNDNVKGPSSNMKRKKSLLDFVAQEQIKLEAVLKELGISIKKSSGKGDLPRSVGGEGRACEGEGRAREEGYSKAEVSDIMVDTYVEGDEAYEVEGAVVRVMDRLDGISSQMELKELCLIIKDLENELTKDKDASTFLLSSQAKLQVAVLKAINKAESAKDDKNMKDNIEFMSRTNSLMKWQEARHKRIVVTAQAREFMANLPPAVEGSVANLPTAEKDHLALLDVKGFYFFLYGQAKQALKNLIMRTPSLKTDYKIIGLCEHHCNKQLQAFFIIAFSFFFLKQKNGDTGSIEISMSDYYEKRGMTLSYSAKFPCINVGKPKRRIYLRLETQETGKYDDEQMLKSCNIKTNSKFTQVKGLVLLDPKLKVGDREDFFPRNEWWNLNSKKLVEPTKVNDQYLTNFLLRSMETFLYFVHYLCSFHALLKLSDLNSMLTTEHGLNISVISEASAMMLGMDVSYGFPSQAGVPSISTLDSNTIDVGIIRELLLDFYTSSRKRKPDQIIVFR